VPAAAASGAAVQSFSALPARPAIGAVVRVQLDLLNESGSAWNAGDTLHVLWRRTSRETALEDRLPLGRSVASGGETTLALVTLAPTAVGDFTLSIELDSHGQHLALGDPMPFHLSGFLFQGRGNGHGLGMSQWGARGRDQAGQDYRSILQAYYQGVSIDQRDTGRPVRVSLTHWAINLAAVWPRLYGPFREIAGPAAVDGTSLSVGAGGVLIFGASAGRPTILAQQADGGRSQPVAIARALVVRATGPAGLRTNLLEELDSDFRQGSEERRYAGTLTIVPQGGASVRLINTLPLEDYLKDVVPAEMPFSWGSEALKAQAVAARTYALRKILLAGPGPSDLEGTTYDQAYGGLGAERPASSEAVDATRGQVLTVGGHLITALYMASGGGHTENSEFGFVRWRNGALQPAAYFSYLRGIADPDDHAPAWQVGPFSSAEAAQIIRDDGEDVGDTLLGIDVLQKGPSGRVLGVRLRGNGGAVEMSGPGLRAVFGLPDTLVDIVGGG